MAFRHRRLLFALLLAAAFGLRVAHNTCLLPPLYDYPNEAGKRDAALALPQEGFHHGSSMPSLLLNSLFLLYFPVRSVYQIGHAHWPGAGPFALDLPTFYLWFGRVYMALFGTAAIAAVYALGKRLHSRSAGWIAALALTVTPIQLLGSRHMKEDMPLGLFVTLAMVFFLDVMRRGRVRDSRRAGFMTGVCFSTKWLGGVVVFPLAAAHLLGRKRELDPNEPPSARRRLGWAFLFVILGFYLFSPDFLIKPDTLFKGVRRGVRKSYEAHTDGIRVDPFQEAFTDYFRTGLWPGLTPPLLALSLIGWAGLLKRRPREAWLLGGWLLFYYGLIETARARPYPHYQRYLQPVIPSFVALAACAVAYLNELARRIPAVARRGSANLSLAAVTGLALIWPAHDSFRYLRNIPRSTICQCAEYIGANVPENSMILDDGYGPDIDPVRYRTIGYRDGDQLILKVFPAEPCYAVVSTYGLGRFLEHPRSNPEITRFVYYILGTGRLEREWRPAFRSFYCESPTIRLYRFDSIASPFVSSAAPSTDEAKE